MGTLKGPLAIIAASLVLAGATGVFVATALGVGQQAPTATTTIDISGVTGPTGATGPAGPKGDPGAESCPTGSTFSAVKFIVQGKGPTTIWVCVAD